MLPTELNDLITLTNPGTVMGSLMRRYWVPALLSEEIPESDCPPVQVRLMGEELVAFRDSQGRVGLLEEHCLHRGTSLFYGRNEECGLRCLYHGWKYDVEGNVLDTPAEPADSNFKSKLKHVAYPCVEAGGMIWAYLGPAEKRPPFPHFYWMDLPASHCYVTKCLQECNYLQGLEGECDSSHLTFLHREFSVDGDQQLYAQAISSYEIEQTDFGLRMIATRGAGPNRSYVRVSSFVLPSGCFIPARNKEFHIYIPADETHSWRYDFGWFVDREATPEDVIRSGEIGPDYRRFKTQANHYQQDREKQRTVNYTGIDNFLIHDSLATETMGARYDRSREHLGVSDKAVIAVRRRLTEAAQAFARGEEPPMPAAGEGTVLTHIDTIAEVIPASVAWREHFPQLTLNIGDRAPAAV